MTILFSKKAEHDYEKLPLKIKLKADRQFLRLSKDYHYSSLRARKMGSGKVFEARIDIQYRFTFQIEKNIIYVLAIGPHDEGLGKK